MKTILRLVFGFVLAFAVIDASAGTTPLQISIFPPVQLAPSDWDVKGVRVGMIMSENRDVYGIDVGFLVSTHSGDFGGISLSYVNLPAFGPLFSRSQTTEEAANTKGYGIKASMLCSVAYHEDFYGWEAAGMCNVDLSGTMRGLQSALMVNKADTMKGVQIAIVGNIAGPEMSGLQLAFYFNTARNMNGLQIGCINYAGSLDGLQIGLVNIARKANGVQIGGLNVITESPVPFMPIINAHF